MTAVEELTGLPRVPRRPGQDPAPARCTPGILADTRNPDHVRQLDDLGVEAVRPRRRPTSTRSATPSPRARPRRSASSRSTSAARRWSAPPPRTTRASPSSRAPTAYAPAGGGARRRRLHARRAPAAGGRGVRAHGELRQRRRQLDGQRRRRHDRRHRLPGVDGRDLGPRRQRCATARTRTRRAALYRHWRPGIAQAEQLHGKEMSYNNYVDADAAVRAAHDHGDQPTVAIIKHANPCGIAVGETLEEAYDKAHACDPQSAPTAASSPTTGPSPPTMVEQHQAASSPRSSSRPTTTTTRWSCCERARTSACCACRRGMERFRDPIEVRPISGGILVQTQDRVDAVVRGEDGEPTGGDDAAYWRLVAGEPADEATLADLAFAWRAIRAVKSNAILLAKDGAAVGVGMGQVNRVDSCRLAVSRAGAERAAGVRGGLRRVLPVRGRAGDPPRRRASARSWRPAARSATRSSSRPPSEPGSPCTSPVPDTSPTDVAFWVVVTFLAGAALAAAGPDERRAGDPAGPRPGRGGVELRVGAGGADPRPGLLPAYARGVRFVCGRACAATRSAGGSASAASSAGSSSSPRRMRCRSPGSPCSPSPWSGLRP